MALPKFLVRTRNRRLPVKPLDAATEEYRSLIGSWLIRITLLFNWHIPEDAGEEPEIFTDTSFLALTGLPSEPLCRRDSRSPSITQCRKVLLNQLKILEQDQLPQNLPLFTNLGLLAEMLDLSEAEQALLLFAALFDLFPTFRDLFRGHLSRASNQQFLRVLTNLTGIPESRFQSAMGTEGVLAATGLLQIENQVIDLEDKVSLIQGLSGVLLSPHVDADELMQRFIRKAAVPSLTLDNFPHLAADSEALHGYLLSVLDRRTTGVNILLSGKPGVGKTEYAQSLAVTLGTDLYEIAYSGPDGEPVRGEVRLRAYSFCQRLLANTSNAVLLFDEVEDVFPSDFGFLKLLFGGNDSGGRQVGGKAWINRTMEQNRVPAIWICNQTEQIDPAYRRRFDYSVTFPTPPKAVRLSIAAHHLDCFEPPREWLERIAANEELTPGQLERAAKVAGLAAKGDRKRALALVEQTLQRSSTLLEQRRTPSRNRVWTGYRLAWLNTDTDIPRLVAGLKKRPQGTFCFYGAAGTGKSELARQMADELGLPVIVRRASDLLDMYVGGSEKNIAAMFDEARQQQALLVLDEADSFLADRRDARQSWEVTQVNELLTQMEAFDGIFICTTNLMERLDQASLRRFAFKIRFDPLKPEQRWGLFRQELERLGGFRERIDEWESQVKQLERLTPGDFAVANRQCELWGTSPTAGELYEQLRRVCAAKGGGTGKIGFGS